jgi:transposase
MCENYGMAKTRTRDAKVLERRRFEAIRRLAAGEEPKEVDKQLDVGPALVYEWRSKANKNGLNALRRKDRSGRPTKLSEDQMKWLHETIRSRNPRDINPYWRYWKLQPVAELIRNEYGIDLSHPTVWRYLRKLGFKPNLPRETGYGWKG